MLKKLLKEIGPILIAVISVLLVTPWFWVGNIPVGLIPIGIVYTLSKPFYDYRKRTLRMRIERTIYWVLQVIYQLWNVVKYVFITVGYIIDLIANVLLGELIEDLVTSEEETLFGKGKVTISAALGELKRKNKLNATGRYICRVLNFLDPVHKDHCIAAINMYECKQSQK